MNAAYEDETGEIADFMAARLDELEAAAEAATPGPWTDTGQRDVFVEQLATSAGTPAEDLHLIAEMEACGDHPDRRRADAEHIILHDPVRVLASAAADRAMLHEHAAFAGIAVNDPSVREWANALGRMVRIRASAWAWHPEYKAGWKP